MGTILKKPLTRVETINRFYWVTLFTMKELNLRHPINNTTMEMLWRSSQIRQAIVDHLIALRGMNLIEDYNLAEGNEHIILKNGDKLGLDEKNRVVVLK